MNEKYDDFIINLDEGVSEVLEYGTQDDAFNIMKLLRAQAQRIDRALADSRHKWDNRED